MEVDDRKIVARIFLKKLLAVKRVVYDFIVLV